jgi:hypothetical protein
MSPEDFNRRTIARSAVAKQVANGALPSRPGSCIVCGSACEHIKFGPLHWRWSHVRHHPSYRKGDELHVVPLCKPCHAHVHAAKRKNPLADPGLMLFAHPTASWFVEHPHDDVWPTPEARAACECGKAWPVHG